MIRRTLDQLTVVAVWEPDPPPMRWRPLTEIFAPADAPERVLWPAFVDSKFVHGHEEPGISLEQAVAEGEATRLRSPISAMRGHRLVCIGPGEFEYISRIEVLTRKRDELCIRLTHALEILERGEAPPEAVMDAFDRAYLVDPFDPIAATLRAGAADTWKASEPVWFEKCVADLNRSVEHGGELLTVRDRELWQKLPHERRRDLLFRSARASLDDYLRPSTSLEVPVGKAAQLFAVATARWVAQRRGGVALRHDLLAEVLRGDPRAVEKAEPKLCNDARWSKIMDEVRALAVVYGIMEEQSILDADEKWLGIEPELASWIARAKLADLERVARTLYHLEIEEEPGRLSRWRAFLQRAQAARSFRDRRPWRQGELMADELRRDMGLDGQPIPEVKALAWTSGIFVGAASLAHGTVDAAATSPRNVPPCVFVDSSRAEHRDLANRFAIAHELAHIIAEHERSTSWACRTAAREESGSNAEIEKRANAFAAYFLAPRHAVLKLTRNELPPPGSEGFERAAVEVMKKFGLTPVTAAEHIINCHQAIEWSESADMVRQKISPAIRQAVYRRARSEMISGFDADSAIDAGPPAPAGTRARQGRFAELVKKWVDAGRIEADKAANLLGSDRASVRAWLAQEE